MSPRDGGLGAEEAKGSEHHVVASEHSKAADSSTHVHKLRVELTVASGLVREGGSVYAVLSHGTLRARTKAVSRGEAAVFNELVDFVTVHRPESIELELFAFNVRHAEVVTAHRCHANSFFHSACERTCCWGRPRLL